MCIPTTETKAGEIPIRRHLPTEDACRTVKALPHSCKAMLAICSDLDETPDADTYFELMRFLNTTDETSMGPGVGLELGNSIYFDMAPGQFSYWNTTEKNREKIRTLIRSGHIDCLHSFGDLATTRACAARALEELAKHDCQLRVWVDHAQAPTNYGADIMKGHGDEPGHVAYHADLTLDYGIQYVWRGRVTSVIGQDQPFSLRDLISDHCPLSSNPGSPPTEDSSNRRFLSGAGALAKECAKQALARLGSRKYRLHAANRVLAPCRLRDGRDIFEFLRCDPYRGGISCCDRGDRIHQVLTRSFLDRLVEREGACILYTHLGKLDLNPDSRHFSRPVVEAFHLLANYYRSGKILVTTTRRLLDWLAQDAQNVQRSTLNSQPSSLWPRLRFPDV